MTQDEIIRMARELATRHGTRMCDENGETHGEELYCVGVDDIAEIIKQVAAKEREKRTQELMQLFLDPENQPTQYGTVTLARSVDAEIEDNEFKPCLESVEQVLLALEKVYAAPQPVQSTFDKPIAPEITLPKQGKCECGDKSFPIFSGDREYCKTCGWPIYTFDEHRARLLEEQK